MSLFLFLLKFHELFLSSLKLLQKSCKRAHHLFASLKHVIFRHVASVRTKATCGITNFDIVLSFLDPFDDLLQVISFKVFKMTVELLDNVVNGVTLLMSSQSHDLFCET